MSARPGDWSCPKCSTVNFASRNACRNNCAGVSRPSNAGPPAAKAGDWVCSCGTNNFASRGMCFSCQRAKTTVVTTPASTTPVVKQGDWVCACGTNNFSSRSNCFSCRNAKPATATVTTPPPPSQPQFTAGGDVSVASTTVIQGDWLCPSCSCNNFASRKECYKCRAPQASAGTTTTGTGTAPVLKSATTTSSVTTPPPAGAKAGDWVCAQCQTNNFGSRTHCYGCAQQRPISTTTAGGSSNTKLDAADAQILGMFAIPGYWSIDAKCSTAQLAETGYFAEIAQTLWSKFAGATSGRKIRKVLRLENVALWHGYCAEVQRLVGKYPAQAAPIPSQWQPKTLQILPDTYHINETYLLHGTSPAVAELIKEGGFDPSHSGEAAGAMFGQGTYFSDSLDKVMHYSKGCIVVSRVALGEVACPPHSNPSSYRRPPQKKGGTEEYDSLVATASKNLKEFIVYRHTKAYPEYLIFHD